MLCFITVLTIEKRYIFLIDQYYINISCSFVILNVMNINNKAEKLMSVDMMNHGHAIFHTCIIDAGIRVY